ARLCTSPGVDSPQDLTCPASARLRAAISKSTNPTTAFQGSSGGHLALWAANSPHSTAKSSGAAIHKRIPIQPAAAWRPQYPRATKAASSSTKRNSRLADLICTPSQTTGWLTPPTRLRIHVSEAGPPWPLRCAFLLRLGQWAVGRLSCLPVRCMRLTFLHGRSQLSLLARPRPDWRRKPFDGEGIPKRVPCRL